MARDSYDFEIWQSITAERLKLDVVLFRQPRRQLPFRLQLSYLLCHALNDAGGLCGIGRGEREKGERSNSDAIQTLTFRAGEWPLVKCESNVRMRIKLTGAS